MVKKKIACYITGGWTECGYMTRFLQKINDTFEYWQRFPQKNIGKKGKSRSVFQIHGETGANLIGKVYADLEKHKADLLDCAAILIEDDMDDQYLRKDMSGRDYEGIEARKKQIAERIKEDLGKEIPVFFFYALPEIEAWFLADWENTFGREYAGKLLQMNGYFSVTFKRYILDRVLTEQYPLPDVENYGYFDEHYKKLSDGIIEAFQGYSLEDASIKNNEEYNKKINTLIEKNELRYSKAGEGMNMLARLRPDHVASVCGHYFTKVYYELKSFRAG